MNLRDLMNKLDGISEATTDFANPGTTPPTPTPAAVDPAKVHQYRRAQQAMANLEKAAQYTGTDEIVRNRAGLPPPLPPIDQWDGKMPAPVGRPDWFNRWFGQGGGMTGDVEKDQTQASSQNDADASTIQTALGQLKQLNDLVAKLGAAKPAPAADTSATQQSAATTGTTTNKPENRDSMTFGQAFAAARKNGEKTFTWKGKSYSTAMASDKQQSAATTGTTTPGFASNGGGATFGNPNISRQGKKAGATQEGVELSIADQLVESFGYTVKEGLAADMGQMAAGGAAGALAGKAAGKMGARFIPGVATGIDAVDAVQRIRDKDYVGAGISTVGALGGLVPGIGGVISGGAAGLNLGRDLAHMYKGGQAPDLKQMQKELGVNPDGVVGPQTIKALKMNPKVGAKYGFGPDGQPMKKESVAEGIASLRDRLAMIESSTNEANYALAAKTAAAGAGDIIDVAPKVIRQGEKFMGMAQEVPKTAIGHTAPAAQAAADVAPAVSKLDKAKSAAKTGANWAKENPGKSTIGAAAVGTAVGYGLTGGKDQAPVVPGPHGQSGDKQTPDASEVGDTEPSVDPQLISQIDELMSALAQVNDPEIQQGLDQARAQVNKFTGGKPLTDFVKSK